MIKVLLIGNGAREHAIAEAIRNSPQMHSLFSYMKSNNPGIRNLSKRCEQGEYHDIERIKNFAEQVRPDFCVVGPEAPLDHGVVDALEKIGVPSVGPNKELAKLETSKTFTRLLMEKHKVPGLPEFRVFRDMDGVKEFLESLDSFVVKPDGLTGGKGVMVHGEHLKDVNDALRYCEEVLKTHESVVVEEKLEGEEFSLQSFTDGKFVIDSPPAQDHKRAYVGDQGPNCYSEDTEILTENGWVTFDKLKKDEKVMTFDPKKKTLKLAKPKKIYWMKYDGKMIHFKHRELDLLVTPNHRMLVKNRKTKKMKIVEADSFQGENEILLSGVWKGKSQKYYYIEEYDYKFNRKLKIQKIKFKDWLRFMGIFLSEGYATIRKDGCRVHVCQTKKSKYFHDFEGILSKLPFKFSFSERDSKFRINSIQLAKLLKTFGNSKEKYIPDYIKNATKEDIIEFLNAFLLGDGDIHYGKMRFHSGSKKMIDDIQELILKIGTSSIITVDKRKKMLNPINKKYYKANEVYSLGIKPENSVGIRKKDISEVNYNGHVGCVTVSTGFVVVRRNNRVAISGNTGGMGSYSCEDHLLPFIKKSDLEEAHRITELVARAIMKEIGSPYRGVMYGGFMVTRDGVKLLEYNARLGDPEAMNVLPILKSDFIDLCYGVISGLANARTEFERKATVCKYVVPKGYPENPVKGERIELSSVPKAKVYYASVDQRPDGLYMSGSRAVAFVGISEDLWSAERIAEEAIKSIKGNVFYRSDIGTKALIEKRIRHMEMIRGSGMHRNPEEVSIRGMK